MNKESLINFANSKEGQSLLTKRTLPLCDISEVETLIKEAVEFVKDDKNNALGLAANQVGSNKSWFVMKMLDGRVVTVSNPKLIGFLGKKQRVEGCFSESRMALVKRATEITVSYTEITGDNSKKEVTTVLKGRDAQVFQHELDHLNGVLICQKGEILK